MDVCVLTVHKGSILYPISIIHIITELVIVVIPFFMMRNVQLTLTTRVKILAAFSARIMYLAHPISRNYKPLTNGTV